MMTIKCAQLVPDLVNFLPPLLQLFVDYDIYKN